MLRQWNSDGEEPVEPALPADLDSLSEAELDALLQQLESGTDAHD